jgi:hypothetical protein
MKYLMVLTLFISTTTFAQFPLSEQKKSDLELLLAKDVSTLIYLNNDCDKPIAIDKERFKEIAKIRAISEGVFSTEGLDWPKIKKEGHRQYGMLKIEAPLGEFCQKYIKSLGDNYKFLH